MLAGDGVVHAEPAFTAFVHRLVAGRAIVRQTECEICVKRPLTPLDGIFVSAHVKRTCRCRKSLMAAGIALPAIIDVSGCYERS